MASNTFCHCLRYDCPECHRRKWCNCYPCIRDVIEGRLDSQIPELRKLREDILARRKKKLADEELRKRSGRLAEVA